MSAGLRVFRNLNVSAFHKLLTVRCTKIHSNSIAIVKYEIYEDVRKVLKCANHETSFVLFSKTFKKIIASKCPWINTGTNIDIHILGTAELYYLKRTTFLWREWKFYKMQCYTLIMHLCQINDKSFTYFASCRVPQSINRCARQNVIKTSLILISSHRNQSLCR